MALIVEINKTTGWDCRVDMEMKLDKTIDWTKIITCKSGIQNILRYQLETERYHIDMGLSVELALCILCVSWHIPHPLAQLKFYSKSCPNMIRILKLLCLLTHFYSDQWIYQLFNRTCFYSKRKKNKQSVAYVF